MPTTVIVGGVAAGMSAATRLRRLDEQREIIVLERGPEVSFANCGLPYHLGGVIPERSSLVLQNPRALGARFRLDVRVHSAVTAIDRAARTVVVSGPDGEYALGYDELVLAMGAEAIRPAIPGAERAHVLRDLVDLDGIMAALDAGPRTAVVLGAGAIGVEVAENLVRRGLRVAVVQRDRQILPGLDPEMAWPLAERLIENGVDLLLGVVATAIDADEVVLATGERIPAELVIAGVGVRPDSALAREAGLELGPSGAIVVDAQQRSSDPAIYAIGDVAEKRDAVLGIGRPVALAGPANRHGRLVADVIAGRAPAARPSVATAIVDVFGMAGAATGTTEKQLVAAGRAHRVIHTHPSQHVGYYPGASPLALKLLVDPETDAILGAQAVGVAGADKRIDVIATAMSAGVTASGLADLELAYSPQYGSAKDPVNMLGYIAENLRDGLDRTLQWHELDAAIAAGATILDVRARGQLAEGSIPGATWIPVEQLRERAAELDGPIVLHCRVGQGAHTAARLLAGLGKDVRNLDGGYLTWRAGTAARAALEREVEPALEPEPVA
ncbi:MAG: FAD-dependent oxidoreductase [Actinomycetales bacterium]|nr:FAD-dependent oxidoreductase [Actinomycetales bacterium]